MLTQRGAGEAGRTDAHKGGEPGGGEGERRLGGGGRGTREARLRGWRGGGRYLVRVGWV